MNKNLSFKKRHNDYNLNRYQKVYTCFSVFDVFHQDTLYKFYSSLKNLFFNNYNYIAET